MYGEDFLGLRELGITSELGVSSLSVPKKLLRAKGARMGAGNSLPYVDPAFVSSARSLTYGISARPTGASRWSLHHHSHRPLHSSHSSQRGWKTKLLDSYDLSTSLVSIPSHNPKPFLPNPHSLPRVVSQLSETLRHLNIYPPSQGSCYNLLTPFQHCYHQLRNSLHNLNHQQCSPFRTTRRARPRRRWDLSGRSLAGSRRTLLRRRSKRKRKSQRCPAPAVVGVAAASMVL